MPLAGWCRECGDWVWVQGDGSCPGGHPADSVTSHYEASPVPDPIAGGVGDGPVPAAMLRFNWGAFLLPALWGAGYGVWALVGWWVVVIALPLVLGVAVGGVYGLSGATQMPFATLIGLTVLSDAVAAFIRLWCGANANRLLWERDSRMLDSGVASRPRFTVPVFLARQKWWVLGGILGAALGAALTWPSAVAVWKPLGLEWAVWGEPVAFLAGQVALGAWLARRMRAENPGTPASVEQDSERQPAAPRPPAPPQL